MIDPDLHAAVRRLGIQAVIVQLRDYCHDRGEDAFDDGYTGIHWYELYDQLDAARPEKTDTQMDGEVRL
jgi:hypothetical protein